MCAFILRQSNKYLKSRVVVLSEPQHSFFLDKARDTQNSKIDGTNRLADIHQWLSITD